MWSFSRAYKQALISPIVKALPWAHFTIPVNVQLFSASNVLVPVLSQNVSNQASAPILPPKLLCLGPSMTTMLLSPMINYSSSTYQQHLKLLTTPSWTPSSCCFCDTFSWIFSSQSDRLFSASFAGSTQSLNTGMPQSSRFSLFSVLFTFVLLEISRTLFPSPYTLRVPNLPCQPYHRPEHHTCWSLQQLHLGVSNRTYPKLTSCYSQYPHLLPIRTETCSYHSHPQSTSWQLHLARCSGQTLELSLTPSLTPNVPENSDGSTFEICQAMAQLCWELSKGFLSHSELKPRCLQCQWGITGYDPLLPLGPMALLPVLPPHPIPATLTSLPVLKWTRHTPIPRNVRFCPCYSKHSASGRLKAHSLSFFRFYSNAIF